MDGRVLMDDFAVIGELDVSNGIDLSGPGADPATAAVERW